MANKYSYTKLVGVSFGNCQKNIEEQKDKILEQELHWEHDKNNEYDKNAIKVYADKEKNIFLGHLSKEMAEDFVNHIGYGTKQTIMCLQVNGGKNNVYYGVNILIIREKLQEQ